MNVILNDLIGEPAVPERRPSSAEPPVVPRNTLGVSSLVASLEDRLRAAGKTLPTLAGPTPQKGVFVRMEEFLEGVKPAERGPAGPLCDCETPDKEDEDELI